MDRIKALKNIWTSKGLSSEMASYLFFSAANSGVRMGQNSTLSLAKAGFGELQKRMGISLAIKVQNELKDSGKITEKTIKRLQKAIVTGLKSRNKNLETMLTKIFNFKNVAPMYAGMLASNVVIEYINHPLHAILDYESLSASEIMKLEAQILYDAVTGALAKRSTWGQVAVGAGSFYTAEVLIRGTITSLNALTKGLLGAAYIPQPSSAVELVSAMVLSYFVEKVAEPVTHKLIVTLEEKDIQSEIREKARPQGEQILNQLIALSHNKPTPEECLNNVLKATQLKKTQGELEELQKKLIPSYQTYVLRAIIEKYIKEFENPKDSFSNPSNNPCLTTLDKRMHKRLSNIEDFTDLLRYLPRIQFATGDQLLEYVEVYAKENSSARTILQEYKKLMDANLNQFELWRQLYVDSYSKMPPDFHLDSSQAKLADTILEKSPEVSEYEFQEILKKEKTSLPGVQNAARSIEKNVFSSLPMQEWKIQELEYNIAKKHAQLNNYEQRNLEESISCLMEESIEEKDKFQELTDYLDELKKLVFINRKYDDFKKDHASIEDRMSWFKDSERLALYKTILELEKDLYGKTKQLKFKRPEVEPKGVSVINEMSKLRLTSTNEQLELLKSPDKFADHMYDHYNNPQEKFQKPAKLNQKINSIPPDQDYYSACNNNTETYIKNGVCVCKNQMINANPWFPNCPKD